MTMRVRQKASTPIARTKNPGRLAPRGFQGLEAYPKGCAGRDGVAVDGCEPSVDVEVDMSRQRHRAPSHPARGSLLQRQFFCDPNP
jgi:hypothetical protein